MKRFLSIVLVLLFLPSFCGVLAEGDGFLVEENATGQETPGNPDPGASQAAPVGGSAEYQEARRMMDAGSLIDALNIFAKQGGTGDAGQYSAYLTATLSLLRNDPAAAAKGFEDLGGFLDSTYQKQVAEALMCHRYSDGEKFGYVNLKGNIEISAQFDWAERVFRRESVLGVAGDGAPMPVAIVFQGTVTCDGTDILPQEGKYGLLRRDGTLAVPMACDEIGWITEGLAVARQDAQWRVFDLASGESLWESYEEVGAYSEGWMAVKKDGKWGYLGRDGQLLAGGFAWDEAQPFSEGYAGVKQNKKAGFIDASGELVIPLEYEDVAPFGQGLAGVRQSKKWGFVNSRGEMAIKPAYQAVSAFHQGRCPVKRGGKWGVIDREGTWIVPYKYDEITDFDPIYHRAWMRNNKLWGLVTVDGTVVLKPTWGTFTPFGADGMSRVSYKGVYGYIDIRGVVRIPVDYDMAAPFTGNLGGVRKGGVKYITKLGQVFDLDSHIPTEPLCGVIEGRKVKKTETPHTDPETGKETVEVSYQIAFQLYDLTGATIEVR